VIEVLGRHAELLEVFHDSVAVCVCMVRLPGGWPHAANRRTGAVTLIQRFGSTLNLNIHFNPTYSPPSRREALTGPVDGAFCDRAHRRRTHLYGEDARPSETPQMRGQAASQ